MSSFSEEDCARRMILKAGEQAPDFCLVDAEGNKVCLHDFLGKTVVLYFYPKDNTPGCTREACDFTSLTDAFNAQGAVVIGISPDGAASHAKFIQQHDLKHLLLSDEDHSVCKMYGVWQVKKNFGREYWGVGRTTFVIDSAGVIEKIYRNVRVKEHAAQVLAQLHQQ